MADESMRDVVRTERETGRERDEAQPYEIFFIRNFSGLLEHERKLTRTACSRLAEDRG